MFKLHPFIKKNFVRFNPKRAALILCALSTQSLFLPSYTLAAENDQITRPLQVGTMVGKKSEFPPIAHFDSVEGWRVEVAGKGSAKLGNSQDVTFFGDSVVKLDYSDVDEETTIRVIAEKPVKMDAGFDAIDWWIWGSRWGYAPVSWVPSLILEDARKNEKIVPFPKYYWEDAGPVLYHSVLGSADVQGRSSYYLKGVQFSAFKNSLSSHIYLGPLSAYLKSEEKRPEGNSAIKLPQPTTPEGIIPQTKNVSTRFEFDEATATWRGFIKGESVDVEVRYTPVTGTLSDFIVLEGGREFSPFQDGGLCFPREKLPGKAKLESSRINPETKKLETFWTIESRSVGKLGEQFVQQVQYQIDVAIVRNSLVLEIHSETGAFERVAFGYASGVENPKLVEIPYLCFWGYHNGALGPKVVLSKGLFMLGMIDLYVSEASDIYASDQGISNSGNVYFNGGSKYMPNTDNERNPVKERLVLSFSKELSEVFPNIPNPPALNQEQAREYVYTQYPYPDLELPLLLHNMGFDKLRYGVFWTVAADIKGREWDRFTKYYGIGPRSFPDLSPEKFAEYLSKFGYLFSVYQYIIGMSATDEFWDRSQISMNSDQNWIQGCAPFYIPKPTALPQLQSKYTDRLKGIINGGIYSDVLTVMCPWGAVTDFDARVPGNGSFQNNLRNVAYVLRKDQEDFGSSWSEGSFNWITAGYATGSYGSLMTTHPGGPSKMPILPEFKLKNMNPLTVNVGMGPGLAKFFEGNEAYAQPRPLPDHHDEFFNQYIAAQLGYGNQVQINSQDIVYGMNGWAKLYYMLRTVQRYYSFETVDLVEYWDGEKFKSTSEAVADESYLDGRLHVRYSNGLDVYVNYNAKDPWVIDTAAGKQTLPQWGFYALHEASGTKSSSSLVNGKRVEYAKGDNYVYVDTWGESVDLPEASVNGVAAIKTMGESHVRVIPCGGNFFGKVKTPDFGCKYVKVNLKHYFPGGDYSKIKVTAAREGIPASGEGDFTIKEPREEVSITPKIEGDFLIIEPSSFHINYDIKIGS